MFPGTIAWMKKRAGRFGAHEHVGCGTGRGPGGWAEWHASGGGGHGMGNGSFGVRRPLRFLAHKLELDEKQVAALARVLDELKTERAQAAVDNRRTLAAFADAVAAESFDAEATAEQAAARIRSAERLRDAVVSALAKIHALLDPEQRERLAYLIRTGTLGL